ncbi:RNA polymerase sigma factor [Chitinophaga defluvii]|uniref:Sigma-70 family RNA polymerase sigma factor n=1 Tax=Chitinophaga defluvii TaxID=3163343 RepID=A0ABV2TES5_9BACT
MVLSLVFLYITPVNARYLVEIPVYHNENEQALLQQVAAGNEAAFTALFDHYWSKVYVHILSFLKNTALSEEVTQDIFLKIWEVRQNLPELNSFKNFLFIITRNRILSELRKKPALPEENDLSILEEQVLVPDRQLRYKEFYTHVMDAIELLPAQKKRVFKMNRVENRSRADIAREMGLTYGTVNQYLVEAISFLKTHLRNKVSGDLLLLFSVAGFILEK